VLGGLDRAFVDEPELDDIDRNLRVVARLQRLPDQRLGFFGADEVRHLDGVGRRPADRVRIAAQPHHLPVDDKRDMGAERLGHLADRAGRNVEPRTGRYARDADRPPAPRRRCLSIGS
jgi:hypothetical protein